jgi:hypothetical protein
MSDKKTEKLFRKAVSAVKAKKGRGLVFGNKLPRDASSKWKVGDTVEFIGSNNTDTITRIADNRIFLKGGESLPVDSGYIKKKRKLPKAYGMTHHQSPHGYRGELYNLIKSLKWDNNKFPEAPVGAVKAKQILAAAYMRDSNRLPRPGYEVLIDEYRDNKNPIYGINASLRLSNKGGRYRVSVHGDLEDYFEPLQESLLLQTRKAKLGSTAP